MGDLSTISLYASLGCLVFSTLAVSTAGSRAWTAHLLLLVSIAITLSSALQHGVDALAVHTSHLIAALSCIGAAIHLVLTSDRSRSASPSTPSSNASNASKGSTGSRRGTKSGTTSTKQQTSSGGATTDDSNQVLTINEGLPEGPVDPQAEWSSLPEAVMGQMLSHLEPLDIMSVRLVCKDWCSMCGSSLEVLCPRTLLPRQLAAAFPHLKSLDLSKCEHGVRASAIKSVLRNLFHVTELVLGKTAQDSADGLCAAHLITDRCVLEVASSSRKLKTLGLAQAVHLGDPGLIAVSSITSLTKVDVSGCVSVTDVGILLLTQLPALETLRLAWCLKLSNAGLKALRSVQATLTSLDVSGCPLLTEPGLVALSSLINLRELQATQLGLIQPALTDNTLAAWSTMQHLTRLAIGCMQPGVSSITDITLSRLASHHAHMASLQLHGFESISDVGISAVAAQLSSSLTQLHLNSCHGITSAFLPSLTALTGLLDLRIIHCPQLPFNESVLKGWLVPAAAQASTTAPAADDAGSVSSMPSGGTRDWGAASGSMTQAGQSNLQAAEQPGWATSAGSTSKSPSSGALARDQMDILDSWEQSQSQEQFLKDCGQPEQQQTNIKAPQLQVLALGCTVAMPVDSSEGDNSLAALASFCGSLKSLSLTSYMGSFSSLHAQQLLNRASQLTTLELLDWLQPSDAGMMQLSMSATGKQLKRLVLEAKAHQNVLGSGVLFVSLHCTSLRSLSLRGVGLAVTNDAIQAVAQNLTLLSHLSVSQANGISDAGLAMLPFLPHLQFLELSMCEGITGSGLGRRTPDQISTLSLGSKAASQVRTEQLVQMSQLHSISLRCSAAVNDAGVRVICQVAPALTSVDLGQCHQVTDDAVDALRTLPHLTNLDLSGCSRLHDVSLQRLSTKTTLTNLQLASCVWFTDQGLSGLWQLAGPLLTLQLDNCLQLSDEGVAHVAQVTSLTSLRLAECPGITDAGVQHLASLTRLSTLSLARCPGVTEEAMMHLTHLTVLASLEF